MRILSRSLLALVTTALATTALATSAAAAAENEPPSSVSVSQEAGHYLVTSTAANGYRLRIDRKRGVCLDLRDRRGRQRFAAADHEAAPVHGMTVNREARALFYVVARQGDQWVTLLGAGPGPHVDVTVRSEPNAVVVRAAPPGGAVLEYRCREQSIDIALEGLPDATQARLAFQLAADWLPIELRSSAPSGGAASVRSDWPTAWNGGNVVQPHDIEGESFRLRMSAFEQDVQFVPSAKKMIHWQYSRPIMWRVSEPTVYGTLDVKNGDALTLSLPRSEPWTGEVTYGVFAYRYGDPYETAALTATMPARVPPATPVKIRLSKPVGEVLPGGKLVVLADADAGQWLRSIKESGMTRVERIGRPTASLRWPGRSGCEFSFRKITAR